MQPSSNLEGPPRPSARDGSPFSQCAFLFRPPPSHVRSGCHHASSFRFRLAHAGLGTCAMPSSSPISQQILHILPSSEVFFAGLVWRSAVAHMTCTQACLDQPRRPPGTNPAICVPTRARQCQSMRIYRIRLLYYLLCISDGIMLAGTRGRRLDSGCFVLLFPRHNQSGRCHLADGTQQGLPMHIRVASGMRCDKDIVECNPLPAAGIETSQADRGP